MSFLFLRTTKTWPKEIAGIPLKTDKDNEPPRCVMDFFEKAGSENNFSDWLNYANTQSTQTPELKIGSNKAVLHKLIASPIHTVQQIEMQQRSAKPRVDVHGTIPYVKSKTIKHSLPNGITSQTLCNQKFQQAEENIYRINHNGVHQSKESKEDLYSMELIEQSLYQSFSFMKPGKKPDVAVGKYIFFVCKINI